MSIRSWVWTPLLMLILAVAAIAMVAAAVATWILARLRGANLTGR